MIVSDSGPTGDTLEGADSLAAALAARIRDKLIAGDIAPGEKFPEQRVSTEFGVSRNTLREAFRLLTSQGLLIHVPNRGFFAVVPDEATVIDIYRVRAVIQTGAIEAARRTHPAISLMWQLAGEAARARDAADWGLTGTLNMEFHRAMVGLCDSARLSACFDLALAELRLVFGQLRDAAHLHEPYVAMNERIVSLLAQDRLVEANAALRTYLSSSEKTVIAALQRDRNRSSRTGGNG